MTKPILSLHPKLNDSLDGEYIPVLYPLDEDRFYKGQTVRIQIYQQVVFEAKIISQLTVKTLPEIPPFALWWTTGLMDIEEARLRYFRHYRKEYNLEKTLFSFSVLEKCTEDDL